MIAQKITMCFIAFIMLSTSMLSFSAANQATDFLQPYSATYSTVWKKGISFKVKGKQTLSKKSDNLWEFAFTADHFLASLKETSAFLVKDHQIIPQKYHYQSNALGKKKTADLTFDWENNQVLNDIKGKPWFMSIPKTALDKLSIQLQARIDLKQGKNEFSYYIADGGHIKNWRFKREKRETINTNLGRVSAIKITRIDNLDSGKRTDLWFAPKFDYLLVKLEHKTKSDFYRLEIEEVTYP